MHLCCSWSQAAWRWVGKVTDCQGLCLGLILYKKNNGSCRTEGSVYSNRKFSFYPVSFHQSTVWPLIITECDLQLRSCLFVEGHLFAPLCLFCSDGTNMLCQTQKSRCWLLCLQWIQDHDTPECLCVCHCCSHTETETHSLLRYFHIFSHEVNVPCFWTFSLLYNVSQSTNSRCLSF